MLLLARRDQVDRRVIGRGRLFITFKPAQRVAKLHMDRRHLGVGLGQLAQRLDGGLGPARLAQRLGPQDFRRVERGMRGRHTVQHLGRKVPAFQLVKDVRGQQQRVEMVGAQRQRHARVDQRIGRLRFARKRVRDREIRLGNPVRGRGHRVEGQHLSGLQIGLQLRHFRRQDGPETLRQKVQRIAVAVELAQHLGIGDDAAPGHAQRRAGFAREQRGRAFEIADQRQRQGLVVMREGGDALTFRDRVELGQRVAHPSGPHLRPGAGKAVHQRPDGLALVEPGQKPVPVAIPRIGREKRQRGKLARLPAVHHPRGHRLGPVDLTKAQIGGQRAFKDRDIAGVLHQRAGIELRGAVEVVGEDGRTRGKVAARILCGERARGKKTCKDKTADRHGAPPERA